MDFLRGLYINGQWRGASGGEVIEVINPATEEVFALIPRASTQDLDDALAAAQTGFDQWKNTAAWDRARLLRKVSDLLQSRADDLARVLTQEQGKPLAEAKGEVKAAAEQFEWYGEEAKRAYGQVIDGHSRAHRLLVMLQPVGPVAAFTPWNFPALLPARKMAAALAAGCSVIVKPAEECPLVCMMMVQACHDAGLPPGVVNLVVGDPAHISQHLLASPVIKKASLTGSVRVGQLLAAQAARGIKKLTMELGGHAPLIVFEDADVAEAARVTALGKFRNNGQVCIATSRIFVHESVQEAFVESFVEVTRALHLGNGLDPDTDLGPLTSERGLNSATALVDDAVKKGAKLLTGGCRSDKFDKGYFFEPAVLTQVDDQMDVMTREPFGPVAPIATFSDFDEVIARANHTDYGLAGYVFTRNTRTAFLASEALEVGMVGVNNLVIASAEIPFGGVKMSGYGREGGSWGIQDYLQTKYINFKL